MSDKPVHDPKIDAPAPQMRPGVVPENSIEEQQSESFESELKVAIGIAIAGTAFFFCVGLVLGLLMVL
ncbi:MAG: hypothetical protein GY913_04500 [Proteobacteria bacterium]|nr:hypothetical protein [Pseudomonadota bacterium]MCP4916162.1 hypothetical protein [Pseudomonadota bacterium]